MAIQQGILVIDIDESFINLLEVTLSSENYPVYSANEVMVMYQILELEAISLLILDYNLNSSHTGLEVAINVKQNYPFVKIVMVTAHVSYELIKAAINSNAIDSFLEKPIMKEELLKMVESNLKKSSTEFHDFQNVIERIKKKESITEEMIAAFGGELQLMNELYKESIRSFPANEQSVMGISIFKNNKVYLQKFLNSNFIIENEFLFSSFLTTLEILSEKFKSEGKSSHEIEFEDVRLSVIRINIYSFVFFHSLSSLKISNNDLKDCAINLYDKLVENNYVWLNENLSDVIYDLNETLKIKV